MITCNIKGGIGNQLFQVAFAYATARKSGRELILLDKQFDGAGQGRHVSNYYDTLFRKVKRCTPYFAQRFQIDEQQFAFYQIQEQIAAAQLPPDSLIVANGYFQSELYFPNMRDELRKLFLPEEGVAAYLDKTLTQFRELLEQNDYCYIGVRRGDYLKHPHIHNPCDFSYYKAAMDRVPAQKYYIASDDIEWCKENFKGEQFVFFEGLDDYVQLLVGALFSKYIISNSTYHWWASYFSCALSPIIVAPDRWLAVDKSNDTCETIYRSEMIILKR
jgi:hypothetical protein